MGPSVGNLGVQRRTAGEPLLLGTLGAIAKARISAAADAASNKPEQNTGQTAPSHADHIAMLVYPKMTALDLIGPQYLFASLGGAKVHLVAKSLEPVTSDTG